MLWRRRAGSAILIGRFRNPRTVPIYFLHLTEGDEYTPDPEGIERRDIAAVQKAAIEAASDLIADAAKKGDYDYRGRLDVEDAHGSSVLTLTFACSVQIEVATLSAENR